jgi:hypothetical protein
MRLTNLPILLAAAGFLQAQPASLTVRVYNRAKVPAIVYEATFRELDVILRHAGLDAHFVACPVALDEEAPAICKVPLRPDLLELQLSAGHSTRLREAIGVCRFNQATMAAMITLFSDAAKAVANASDWTWPDLQAHLIAHEIGHALLGTNAHALAGIMQANWSAWDLARLNHAKALFLPAQARQMQVALANRVSLSQALP